MVIRIDNEELSLKVRRVLLKVLRAGDYEQSGKLPSEEELAKKLGVSRGVLRDVLATLESEGFISRRRGVGTVINKHVLDVKTRLDVEKDFLEMVEEAGFKATVDGATANWLESNEEIAMKLQIPVGAKVLAVDKRILANGEPAIYLVDYIPENIFVTKKYTAREIQEPIFRFLKKKCNTRVETVLMEVGACLASINVAQKLEISPGDPVLSIPELAYTFEQNPVLWSEVYYRKGFFDLTMLRKNYLR